MSGRVLPAGVEHGTYAALQVERKAGEGTCPECRDAAAVYVRQWRRRRTLIDPLGHLLQHRPELADMAQVGARFYAGLTESA